MLDVIEFEHNNQIMVHLKRKESPAKESKQDWLRPESRTVQGCCVSLNSMLSSSLKIDHCCPDKPWRMMLRMLDRISLACLALM